MTADDLIRQLGGCGTFQCCVSIVGSLVYISGAFTTMFMSFGMYNPGWRCLDSNNNTITVGTNTTPLSTTVSIQVLNNTTAVSNSIITGNDQIILPEEFTDSCDGFEECKHVQFNTKESTIATEWGLICGSGWKASTITSIQMAGMTVGNFISGILGDKYGRRIVMGCSVFLQSVLTFISIAAVSWEMFAALKFLIGMTSGVLFCMSTVYMTEFVTPKWRAIIPSLPMWMLGCVMLSLCAVAFKDWRYIHIFSGVFTILLLIPVYIFPESLRWLIIRKEEDKSVRAVKKMAKFNRVVAPEKDIVKSLVVEHGSSRKIEKKSSVFSVIHIFKKGVLGNTLILSFILFVSNILYWSSSFGVASLPGDLYLNNIILYATELPANLFAWFAPNIFGRKIVGIWGNIVQGISLAVFLVLNVFTSGSVKTIGTLVTIVIARNCVDVVWFVALTCTGELFPTTIRAAATGCMMFVSGVAGVLSPYLVMNDNVMVITYIAVVVLSLAGGFMFCFIPETLGIDLKDDDDDETSSQDLKNGDRHLVDGELESFPK